jgi:Tol biopolymer transport system component
LVSDFGFGSTCRGALNLKDVRIDYPVWSPDGKWFLFDRFRAQGGDIWMIENFE